MASTSSMFFLLFLLLFAKTNHCTSNIISLGSWLSPKTNSTPSWVSPSGLFAFGFYPQANGFAIGIWLITGELDNTIMWTARRDDPPVSADSTLNLTTNGLVLFCNEKHNKGVVNITDLVPEYYADLASVSSASMLDSGNFVLYDNQSGVVWQSFDYPTDTILGNQTLAFGDELVSSVSKSDHSSGKFILSMQDDGNLAAYPANSMQEEDCYWSTYTYATSSHLSLDLAGVLSLWDQNKDSILHVLAKSTNLGRNIYRATLDERGIFALYQHRFDKNLSSSSSVKIVWRVPSDPCDVKGICVLNSYCSTRDNDIVLCQCYPGFVPLERDNKLVACKKNQSTEVACETIADPPLTRYNLTSLRNMTWTGLSYSTVLKTKIQACGKSCMEDCYCGAALYVNGSCNKYAIPLKYGRVVRNTSSSAIMGLALFKLPLQNTSTPSLPTPLLPLHPKILIDNKKSLIFILLLALGSIAFFCLVFAMLVFFIYKRQAFSYAKLSASANLGFTEEFSLRAFSFDELEESTGDFSEEIGRGSFGTVYKGTIRGSNRKIAVKKLDEVVVDEGEREFRAEINTIARTHHRNLVQLIGFCIDGSRKLLVYEYMSNGSLSQLLFKEVMRLSWKQRVKIALDVARGILYLHEECEVCIVHCNIKLQNILMDEAWTAKISDFGLARLLMPEHSRAVMRNNERKVEYLAPERQRDQDASVSVKADIYSYGVVLMEIICCRRSIDVNVSSDEEVILSNWVYKCFVNGEMNKLVADEGVEWKTMERMVKVGLWCVQEDPSLRPSMKNVILMLEGLKNIPVPPSPATI